MSGLKTATSFLVASSLLSFFPATAALADDTIDVGDVVVSANRIATKKDKIGSAVEVVTNTEIEQQSKPYIGDYLTQLPGVTLSDSGGPGKVTGIFMRGAASQYIKTQINGIDISDPSATQSRPMMEQFLAGGMERIEVLKGSQSMLYGGSAVAGVIDMSTLAAPDSGVQHRVFGEAGYYSTLTGGYSLNAADERGQVSFKVLGVDTSGFSAADKHDGNHEKDSYNNLTILPAFSFDVSNMLTIFGSGLVIKSKSEYDDDFGPSDNDYNHSNYTQLAGRAGVTARFMDERFINTLSVQHMQLDRELHSLSIFGPYDADYTSSRTKVDYVGSFEVNDMVTVMAGADYENVSAKIKDAYSKIDPDADTTGFWGQVMLSPLENLTITGGGRYDHHSDFGSFGTYRTTIAYLIAPTGTKLRSSVGSGFRAPSLYELYAPFGYGNDKLKAEKSFSWDVGFDQELPNGLGQLSVSYFELNTKRLIDYDFSTFRYEQISGKTKRRGVEVGLQAQPTDWLGLAVAYTYTHTKKNGGGRLLRVPKHDIGFAVNITPYEKWAINLSAKAAIDTIDVGDYDLDDYFTLAGKVSYQAHDNIELYVRGENLTDKQYQVVKGYGTSDFAIYGGFNARF